MHDLEKLSTRICCVMASDALFFHQTRASIETFDALRKSIGADLKVISLALSETQMDWLKSMDVGIATDVPERVPRFAGAPLHTIAMTCRPWIPELFPGYGAYMWIDSDIRFLHQNGFLMYVQALESPRCSIAISHETEPAYGINRQPEIAGAYHRQKIARLRMEFGDEIAHHLEFMAMYNAGIFSAPASSPIWARYKRNLEKVIPLPYDRMREQDALLVSITEVQDVVSIPSVANWLCSLQMPVRAPSSNAGAFLHPDGDRQILVAHLTNSSEPITVGGKQQTLYDIYQTIGLTK